MHYSSFFQFAVLATLTALVDVSYAAPQGPGFPSFGRPGSNVGRPGASPSQPSGPSLSTVCMTSSKAPAVKGRPTTQYTTVTTCTTTSTLVVNTTVSPPPDVTTSTLVTTSTTTGPISTDTATTSIFTTITETTTLPVSTVSSVTTITNTVTFAFANVRDTLPTATFVKRQHPATTPGFSPNRKVMLGLGKDKSFGPFAGDVTCTVYQTKCAIVTQTVTSTTTLASTTLTSFATSTVVVTSIPVASTTVTVTDIATTTSTVTPEPTTTISTVTTTTTVTSQVDKCSPSNMVTGINGRGIMTADFGQSPAHATIVQIDANTLSSCCLAVNADPLGGMWAYVTGRCYSIVLDTCSAQSQGTGVVQASWQYNTVGEGYTLGNARCGMYNSWFSVD